MAYSVNSPFYSSPFPNQDIIPHVISRTGLTGVLACSPVSKAWNKAMGDRTVWQVLFDTEKVLRLSGDRAATAREDFRDMYLRTIRATQMAPLGQFVGTLPLVDFSKHEIFKTTPDAYDSSQMMEKTWTYIVKPEYIRRDYDEKLVKLLQAEGDVEIGTDTGEKKELLIPFTIKNLIVIANYVGAKKGLKVFDTIVHDNVRSNMYNKLSKGTSGVRITQMRKEAPGSTRNKTWVQQQEQLAEKGHEVADLETLALYYALNVLNEATGPNRQQAGCCMRLRTSTEVKDGNNTHSMAIESFPYDTGFRMGSFQHNANNHYVTVPVISAEVRPPSL